MARKVQIAVIKDNRPAGDFTDHDLPREGKFDDPQPVRRRCGVAKDWDLELRMTDPIVCHLIAFEYE